MILTITGPSGVGKTTLLHNLLKAYPEAYALESITTRAPRPTDEGGYVYMNEEEFKETEKRGEFLWTAHPHTKSYGTRKDALDTALAHGFSVAVLIIEAVEKLHAYAKDKQQVRSLYIKIDEEEELRRRFLQRDDMSEKEIEARIAECRSWNERARNSSVPFYFLDGIKSREELLRETLQLLDTKK